MQPSDFIEANRKMWNETADIHAQVHGSKLLERVKAPDKFIAQARQLASVGDYEEGKHRHG